MVQMLIQKHIISILVVFIIEIECEVSIETRSYPFFLSRAAKCQIVVKSTDVMKFQELSNCSLVLWSINHFSCCLPMLFVFFLLQCYTNHSEVLQLYNNVVLLFFCTFEFFLLFGSSTFFTGSPRAIALLLDF